MSLASCQKCKKLFQKVRNKICPACEAEDEVHFETVRQYLSENSGHNAEQASEGSGVPLDVVLRFVGTGRFQAEGIAIGVTCGKCGAQAISATKKLCQACLEKLNWQIAKQQSRIKLPDKKQTEVGRALNTYHMAGQDTSGPLSGK